MPRPVEGRQQCITPGPVVAGMVDLVQDHERPGGPAGEGLGRRGHLLVGGHDAVHVGRERPMGRCPPGFEVEVKCGGSPGPLKLEMSGGHHDHKAGGGAGQGSARRRQGERRLARSGGGDGQEVGALGPFL